jgi:hypothetical protein
MTRPDRDAISRQSSRLDYLHGQDYAAPDGIELHPILGFRSLG